MAEIIAPGIPQSSQQTSSTHVPKINSIKSLAESPDLTSIPASYTFTNNPNDTALLADDPDIQIPIIDFSLLASGKPDLRSRVVTEIGKACENYGFFIVTNHGVPKTLMDAVMEGCREFFDLSEEEKLEFQGKHVMDPIRCGTSFNASIEKVFYWRDFLKVFVHPQFHFPDKPSGFSDVASEYCKRIREIVMEILKGISENLGLESNYIIKALDLDSSFQIFHSEPVSSLPTTRASNGTASSFRSWPLDFSYPKWSRWPSDITQWQVG